MCGIVGMVSKRRWGFSSANLAMFDTLLYMDALRGDDSTGVFSVSNIGNVTIAKEAVTSSLYLPDPAYKKLRASALSNGWALIGHNRKATRGVINDENAHPFWVEDKLVLVHNGTVFGDHKKLKDTEVDSHAIAHTLAEHENVEEALQKVNAAYALVWYNVQKKQLNLIRNKERPLAWLDTDDALFIASEGDMLEFVARRHGVKVNSKTAWSFEPDTLDTWGLNKDKSMTLSTTKIDTKYRYPDTPVTQHGHPYVVRWPYDQPRVDACAYSGYGGEHTDPCEDVPELLARQEQALTTNNHIVELRPSVKVVSTRPAVDHPQWSNLITFREWNKLKDHYSKKRIRVEVKDYLSDDAGPEKAWMTGQTIDGHKCFVVFSIPISIFKAITEPGKPASAVFTVEVDTVEWKRSGDITKIQQMDEWVGNVTLMGKEAKLHIDINGNRVQ